MYAGALFIKYAIGIEGSGQEGLYLSILVLLAIAGFFCIVGGLQAVIWTDFVQTILMVIGVLILMGLCKLNRVFLFTIKNRVILFLSLYKKID